MKFTSNLISAVSGSIGGSTAARNKGGMYMRSRSVPVNPRTPEQQAVRAAVSYLAQAWLSVLTPGQRDQWNAYAASRTIIDTLGVAKHIPALAWYIKLNTVRYLNPSMILLLVSVPPTDLNDAQITTPPSLGTFVAGPPSTVSVTFDNTDPWATTAGAMAVYISRPVNLSINFFKGPYRFAGVIRGGAVAPTSPAVINTPFPTVAGQRLFARFGVTDSLGRSAAPLTAQIDT